MVNKVDHSLLIFGISCLSWRFGLRWYGVWALDWETVPRIEVPGSQICPLHTVRGRICAVNDSLRRFPVH